VPRGWRFRLPGEAVNTEQSVVGAAHLAASVGFGRDAFSTRKRLVQNAAETMMTGHDKVNILLVDDQPAKLSAYEVILRNSERI